MFILLFLLLFATVKNNCADNFRDRALMSPRNPGANFAGFTQLGEQCHALRRQVQDAARCFAKNKTLCSNIKTIVHLFSIFICIKLLCTKPSNGLIIFRSALGGNRSVNPGGLAFVPYQALYVSQIRSVFEQMRCKTLPRQVPLNFLFYPCSQLKV